MLDALLRPPFAELSLARNLMDALTPVVQETARYVPNVEISEKDGNYMIDVALPGFTPDDIEIDISGNDLTISGTYERSREDRRTHYTEFTQASFARTITLPQEINVDQVTATFDNGVLHIVAPPMAPIAARRVSISGSGSGSDSSQQGARTGSGQTAQTGAGSAGGTSSQVGAGSGSGSGGGTTTGAGTTTGSGSSTSGTGTATSPSSTGR
jgi:HSP20 family protein